MKFPFKVFCVALAFVPQAVGAADIDGRPLESVWAHRTTNPQDALVDFETEGGVNGGWTCESHGAEATLARTTEKRMFGDWSLGLRARGLEEGNWLRIRPARPIPLTNAYDRVSVWIRGEKCAHGAARDPDTTQCPLFAVLDLADGSTTNVPMREIAWANWHYREVPLYGDFLSRAQGAAFDGFVVSNVTTKGWRAYHFDDIAIFKDPWTPRVYPDVMTNLSFAIRADTILPDAKPDARLAYRYAPGAAGPRLFCSWDGEEFEIFACGGVTGLANGDDMKKPEPIVSARELSCAEADGAMRAVWRYKSARRSATVSYEMRRKAKSLVVDVASADATVVRFSTGFTTGRVEAVAFSVPYLTLGWWKSQNRPRRVTTPRGTHLFASTYFDWYTSGSSLVEEGDEWRRGEQVSRQYPKTDGTYNTFKERLFFTVSDDFAEVLPTIPNPKSPYMGVTGTKVWRAHAIHDIEQDKRLWKAVHDAGMTEVAICDHEPMWYDDGESFTWRTNTIPSKGGDAAVAAYSRYLREDLGFVYGVYDNVTDYAPVNAAWDRDNVTRWSEGHICGAWVRCYAPKPCLAPWISDTFPPVLKEKFGFDAVYSDVITTSCPWWRTDYDHRVPGAGRYAPVFYAFCEALLRHKKAFGGPVWSEGRQQMMYAGFADGSYAQCGNLRGEPWIVDFDLRKIHPLCCNFGMGCLSMYQPPKTAIEAARYIPHAPTPKDREELLDRFVGATLAFGHSGYLVLDYLFDPPKTFGLAFGGPGRYTGSEDGWRLAKRSYFMVQAIAARYTQAEAKSILYPDDDGALHGISEALFLNLPARQQVAVEYANGTFVVVNGHSRRRLKTTFGGRAIDLCPLGYLAWTADGAVFVESNDAGAGRIDVARGPAYDYCDDRKSPPVVSLKGTRVK